MHVEGIYQIAGKTIERVIVKENKRPFGSPGVQIFLIFTDHTYYELYGAQHIGFSSCVDQGGRGEVLKYLNSDMRVVYEGFLNEDGMPDYNATYYHDEY